MNIVVTEDVFHWEMSALNVALSLKAENISVTRLTSQSGIGPYSLSVHRPSTGFVSKHDVIAAENVSSVKAVNDGGGLGGGALGGGGICGDDDEHPKDSVIVKLDAPFPPVSLRYPSLIVTVYSPASASAEEIGTVIVHEFLPFVS